jgi:hypothetical protein
MRFLKAQISSVIIGVLKAYRYDGSSLSNSRIFFLKDIAYTIQELILPKRQEERCSYKADEGKIRQLPIESAKEPGSPSWSLWAVLK